MNNTQIDSKSASMKRLHYEMFIQSSNVSLDDNDHLISKTKSLDKLLENFNIKQAQGVNHINVVSTHTELKQFNF